jgi:hypothetical protein
MRLTVAATRDCGVTYLASEVDLARRHILGRVVADVLDDPKLVVLFLKADLA